MMISHSNKPTIVIWIYKLNNFQKLYPLQYTEFSDPVPSGLSIIKLADKLAKKDNIISVWVEWDIWKGDLLIAKNTFNTGMIIYEKFFDSILHIHYSK